jgi:hypothetical protein
MKNRRICETTEDTEKYSVSSKIIFPLTLPSPFEAVKKSPKSPSLFPSPIEGEGISFLFQVTLSPGGRG